MTATLVLLTGFNKPGVESIPLAASVQVQMVTSDSKDNFLKSKQKKIKNKHFIPSADQGAELQKSLDLSIPFKDIENASLKLEQNRLVPEEPSNMFAAEKKKKPSPLDLGGQMLMSQEPEVDKRKSFDGAGIVINLKR